MNHFNTNNLKDIITSTLQEILTEDPNFFFTDQLKILSWKSKKINGALITKVGQRRYLGLLRKDCQGQEYWKYKPLTGNSNSELSAQENLTPQPTSSLNQSELDPITKFQQRQAQTEQLNNYGKSTNSEQSVNS